MWMLDTLRLVSSEDIGRDESSVQVLLKKHKDTAEELNGYAEILEALREQAKNLGDTDRDSPEVRLRVFGGGGRYGVQGSEV